LLTHQSSFGQDSSKLSNDTWITLRTLLLKRTHVVTQLINFLQQNKNFDSTLLGQLKSNASNLSSFLNSCDRLDSNLITNIHDINDSLSISINKTYNLLLTDKGFNQTDTFIYIATELEGTENRIYIAVKDYNQSCKSMARPDLYFKKLWGDEP
jgi:hypothetical protein